MIQPHEILDQKRFKTANRLTDEERQAFLDGFYGAWESTLSFPPDYDSPTPFGSLWYYHSSFMVQCETLIAVEETGVKYFEFCKHEIQALYDAEQQAYDAEIYE